MNFFAIFFDAATVAAGRILRERNRYTELDYDLFAQVANPIYKAASERLMGEWENAVEATISEATLRQLVNVQATELGVQVADAYHEEMVWAS